MAAVYQRENVGIRRIGRSVTIPNDPRAKIMFYLDCICNVLDLEQNNPNMARLRDYEHYYQLTEGEMDVLTLLCAAIGPDQLNEKCIFNNDSMCGNSQNAFYELEAVKHQMLLTEQILINGKQTRVCKIMFYKMAWIQENYIEPMVYLLNRIEERKREEEQRRTRVKKPSRVMVAEEDEEHHRTRATATTHNTYSSGAQSSECCCVIL